MSDVHKKKRSSSQTMTIMIIAGLILGIIVGSIFNIFIDSTFVQIVDQYIFNVLGQVFLNLIFMMVVPVVFISIVLGVINVGDPKKLGVIGLKTVGIYLMTTAIAITIAMGVANLLNPGEGRGILLESSEVTEYRNTEFGGESDVNNIDVNPQSFDETIISFVPKNFFSAMAETNMIQIITFAIFIGIAIIVLQDKVPSTIKLLQEFEKIVMTIVMAIMKYFAALGAFGLVATAFTHAGFGAIESLGMYFLCVLIALLLHFVLIYGSMVRFFAKKSFLWFIKGFAPAMTVGFSTSSSSAVLPVSLKAAQENLKIRESISSFVQPLGATVNMDGTAIMQGVATVFIAQLSGVDLSITEMVTVVVIATIASIGTAGVPGVGLIMLAMVLTSIGLDPAAIGIIIGIDRLLDMTRTVVNISGDAAVALVINEQETRKSKVTN